MIDITEAGRSLRYAWVPTSHTEYESLIDGLRCPACERRLNTRKAHLDRQQLGSVHYVKRICSCRCGFENFWYFIENLLDANLPLDSPEAVELALLELEQNAQLEDLLYEVGVFKLAVAAERKELPLAIQLAEQLVAIYRGDAQLFFYLGYFYAEADRLDDAMLAYHSARRIDPTFLEPLYNQGIVLTRMGRIEEGRQFLSHYDDLNQGKAGEALPDEEHALETAKGNFGLLAVLDSGLYRRMTIEQQSQGSAFKFPSAQDFVAASADGPGAFPESPYTIGMLLAGAGHAAGKGLVLGLGSGIGVTFLLAAFPELRLTVVELDPMVVRFARQYFPLVAAYEQQERLQIVAGDAFEYVAACSAPNLFDFCLLDLYQGQPEQPHAILLPNFLGKLAEISKGAIWPNLIGKPNSAYFSKVRSAFDQAGLPLQMMSAGVDRASRNTMDRNWIMTTETWRPELLRESCRLEPSGEAAAIDQGWPLFESLPSSVALRLVRATLQSYVDMALSVSASG